MQFRPPSVTPTHLEVEDGCISQSASEHPHAISGTRKRDWISTLKSASQLESSSLRAVPRIPAHFSGVIFWKLRNGLQHLSQIQMLRRRLT